MRNVLKGADGGPLRVDVRTGSRPGETRPAVLICHGFKGFKDWGFFPVTAARLARAGFAAVSFNFSGSGVSGDSSSVEGQGSGSAEFDELERWAHQKPSADLQDLATVADFASSELGAPWLALLGHSRGGALAVLHAARDPRVRALVTWAAIDHFLRFSSAELERWRATGRLDVVNLRTGQVLPLYRDALDDVETHGEDLLNVISAAARVRAPWLLVHGTNDATVPVETALRLSKAAADSSRSELLLLDGADHTFGIRHPWAGSTPEFDAVLDRTVGWVSGANRI
ncbi:MAG TPA: alpha/beta fold hydrolase [Gemmatimonadales bacterium]|nr:alpha/beta fold hydrolase [Gemmatimonadales bacterium]